MFSVSGSLDKDYHLNYPSEEFHHSPLNVSNSSSMREYSALPIAFTHVSQTYYKVIKEKRDQRQEYPVTSSWQDKKNQWRVLFYGLQKGLRPEEIAKYFPSQEKITSEMISEAFKKKFSEIQAQDSQDGIAKLANEIGLQTEELDQLKELIEQNYVIMPLSPFPLLSSSSTEREVEDLPLSSRKSVFKLNAKEFNRDLITDVPSKPVSLPMSNIWENTKLKWQLLFQGLVKEKLTIVDFVKKYFNDNKVYRRRISNHCGNLANKIRSCSDHKQQFAIQKSIGFERRSEDFKELIAFLESKYQLTCGRKEDQELDPDQIIPSKRCYPLLKSWDDKQTRWKILFQGLITEKLTIAQTAKKYFENIYEYTRLISSRCKALIQSIRKCDGDKGRLLEIQASIGFKTRSEDFDALIKFLSEHYSQNNTSLPSELALTSVSNQEFNLSSTTPVNRIKKKKRKTYPLLDVWENKKIKWKLLFQGLVEEKLRITKIVEKYFKNIPQYIRLISAHCNDLRDKINSCKDEVEVAAIQTSIGFADDKFKKLTDFLDSRYGKRKRKRKSWVGVDIKVWKKILIGLTQGSNLDVIYKEHFSSMTNEIFSFICTRLNNDIKKAQSDLTLLEKIRKKQTTLDKEEFQNLISLLSAQCAEKSESEADPVQENKKRKENEDFLISMDV